MDSLRSTVAGWMAPTSVLTPVKEEPKIEETKVEKPKIEEPKELSFEQKAEVVMEKVQTFIKIVGLSLLGLAALYSTLDKGSKVKAGRLGASLEASGNLTKFLLNNDVEAGSKGIDAVYKLFSKQTAAADTGRKGR